VGRLKMKGARDLYLLQNQAGMHYSTQVDLNKQMEHKVAAASEQPVNLKRSDERPVLQKGNEEPSESDKLKARAARIIELRA